MIMMTSPCSREQRDFIVFQKPACRNVDLWAAASGKLPLIWPNQGKVWYKLAAR
jgi:hypothetical protein